MHSIKTKIIQILILSQFLFALSSLAQQSKLDSLLKVNKTNTKPDLHKIQLLNSLSELYLSMQLDSGLFFVNQAIDLAQKSGNQKELATAFKIKSTNLSVQGKNAEAEEFLKKSLSLNTAVNDINGLAENYLILGRFKSGEESISTYQKAIELFKQAKNANGIAKANLSLGAFYRDSDLKRSLQYLNEALNEFKIEGNNIWISYALICIGQTYYYFSDLKSSRDFVEKGLVIAKQTGNRFNTANAYSTLGNIYNSNSNFPKAFDYFLNSMKIAEAIKNKPMLANSYSQIGNVCLSMKNYEDALKYTQKALLLANEVGRIEFQTFDISLIGTIYLQQGKYNEALKQEKMSLALNEKSKNEYRIENSYGTITDMYLKIKDYDNAFLFLNKAITLNKNFNDPTAKANNFLSMAMAIKNAPASVLIKQRINPLDRNSILIYNLTKCIDLVNELGLLDRQRDALFELSEVYQKEGNIIKAFEYYKQYTLLKDSIMNADNSNSIANLQIQFETNKKEQEIVLLNKDKALQFQEIDKQKAVRNSFIIGFILVLLLVGVTYNRYRLKQKANEQLAKTLATLKNTQEQLVKTEKMAAFGVMATRVAHEIQNPLNFVNNFSELSQELIQDMVSSNSEEDRNEAAKTLLKDLELIKQHGKRAANIVKQLQEHSNAGTAQEYFESKNI
ncbi:MAG TPA: tetratricopeptide repeat protein [Saprospiraceae bacterium]|nr:tetratricopeptide repeat protein [Saprospiraceae bacterium]